MVYIWKPPNQDHLVLIIGQEPFVDPLLILPGAAVQVEGTTTRGPRITVTKPAMPDSPITMATPRVPWWRLWTPLLTDREVLFWAPANHGVAARMMLCT